MLACASTSYGELAYGELAHMANRHMAKRHMAKRHHISFEPKRNLDKKYFIQDCKIIFQLSFIDSFCRYFIWMILFCTRYELEIYYWVFRCFSLSHTFQSVQNQRPCSLFVFTECKEVFLLFDGLLL